PAPPATGPNYGTLGSPGTPATASTRPPRKGPIKRHFIPLSEFSLSVCAERVAAASSAPRTTSRSKMSHRARFVGTISRPPTERGGGFYLCAENYVKRFFWRK